MSHGDRKTARMRGSRNHGYGNTQKHRGAGSRGGRGMAGSKKQKWSYVSKYLPGYFGKKGFKRPQSQIKTDTTINVGYISANISKFVASGAAKKEKSSYSLDLSACGYTKLLGSGKVEIKLDVSVVSCSAKARQKIEAAGGSVTSEDSESESNESKKSGD